MVAARRHADSDAPAKVLVIAGVAGVGKSTVMAELGRRLGWAIEEGDALHPAANVAKMAAGVPLTDEDRRPWLEAVRRWIERQLHAGRSGIVTSSALRRPYRDLLADGLSGVRFVQLVAPRGVLEARIRARRGHFMPASLLDSQLETFEPLREDEPGWQVDASGSPEEIVEEILCRLEADSGD